MRRIGDATVCGSLASRSAGALDLDDEFVGGGVPGHFVRHRDMTAMNGRDVRGEQLELSPRIGPSEPLLRPEDAAELLSVKVSWIYEACRTGRLPFLRVGKHLRFTRSDLERWLASQRSPSQRAHS